MPTALIFQLLLAAVENMPTLIQDGQQFFRDVSGQGPQGVARVQGAVHALAQLTAHAASAVNAAAPQQQPAQQPALAAQPANDPATDQGGSSALNPAS